MNSVNKNFFFQQEWHALEGGNKNTRVTSWKGIMDMLLEQSTRVWTVTLTPYTGDRVIKTGTCFTQWRHDVVLWDVHRMLRAENSSASFVPRNDLINILQAVFISTFFKEHFHERTADTAINWNFSSLEEFIHFKKNILRSEC